MHGYTSPYTDYISVVACASQTVFSKLYSKEGKVDGEESGTTRQYGGATKVFGRDTGLFAGDGGERCSVKEEN